MEVDSRERPSSNDNGGMTRVFLEHLPEGVRKVEIEKTFSRFGRIAKIYLIYDPPGSGFVEYFDSQDAEYASSQMDGADFLGAQLKAELTKGRQPRGPSDRGGGGGSRDYSSRSRGSYGSSRRGYGSRGSSMRGSYDRGGRGYRGGGGGRGGPSRYSSRGGGMSYGRRDGGSGGYFSRGRGFSQRSGDWDNHYDKRNSRYSPTDDRGHNSKSRRDAYSRSPSPYAKHPRGSRSPSPAFDRSPSPDGGRYKGKSGDYGSKSQEYYSKPSWGGGGGGSSGSYDYSEHSKSFGGGGGGGGHRGRSSNSSYM